MTRARARSHSIPTALVLLALMLAPGTLHADETRALRVVSFNVWGVPVVSPARPERITEIGRRLAALNPDVVALQEVWEDDDAERVGPTLAAAGLTFQRHFGRRQVGGRGSGLWMASRYPIVGERFVKFELGHKPYIHWHLDYLSSKGVALLELETPAGLVTIANTHFQSTYTFGDYTFIQLSQALAIAEAAAEVSTPLIVVGDINAEPSSIVSEVLMAKLGLAPASASFGIDIIAARSSANTSVAVGALEHRFEDRVLMQSGVKRTLSDHPCVLADYRLGPCDDCGRPSSTWVDVRPKLLRFIEDNEKDTDLFMVSTRALSIGLVPLSLFLLRLGRKRRVRGRALAAGVGLVLILLLASAWLAYVGWSYGPYKLEALAVLRAMAGT